MTSARRKAVYFPTIGNTIEPKSMRYGWSFHRLSALSSTGRNRDGSARPLELEGWMQKAAGRVTARRALKSEYFRPQAD